MSNKQAIDIIDYMIKKTKLKGWNGAGYMLQSLEEAKYRIQSLPDTDEWISADNPPTHFKNVLVIANGIISIASYDKMYDGWVYNDEITDDGVVTFWKELPALPTPPITK